MLKRILFAAAFLLWSIPAFATTRTFYVSKALGNDSNNGTSTATPWKSVPTMDCGSGWNGVAIGAGNDDTIILRGGETWGRDSGFVCMGWTPTFNGTSGHPVTLKGDPSWYAGGSFTRPVFDAEYITANTIQFANNSYINLDNIEFKRSTTAVAENNNTGLITGFGTHDINGTNLYIHGWRVTGSTDGHVGGMVFRSFNSTAEARTISCTDCVIENSENTGSGFMGGEAANYVYDLTRTIVHDVSSLGISLCNFSDGQMYNVSYPSGNSARNSGAFHVNGMSADTGLFGGVTCTVKNSIFHDVGDGVPDIYMLSHGSSDPAVYAYNNVIYGHIGDPAYIVMDNYDQFGNPGGNYYIWNNLVDASSQTGSPHPAVRLIDRTGQNGDYEIVDLKNNYFIGPVTIASDDVNCSIVSGTCTFTTNYPNNHTMQLTATATGQGFTSARLYRMIDTSNNIYHAGTDLSGSFTVDINNLTRTGTWDIGPYIFQTHHDYYVATDGFDFQNGTLALPFLTFPKAQSVVVCGDYIIGRGGTYAGTNFIGNVNSQYVECPSYNIPVLVKNYASEHVILKPAGGIYQAIDFSTADCTPDHYWKIIANHQGDITVDCLNCAYQSNYSVRLSGNYVWMENVEVENAWQSGISAGCNGHTLINLNVHNNGNVATSPQPHGIYASTTNMLIDGGSYHDNCCGFGIQIFASGHSDLDDNVVRNTRIYNNGASSQDNCCGGLGVFNGHRNLAYNNLIYNNPGGNAVDINFLITDAAIYNNSIFGNSGACVAIGSSTVNGIIVKNNICFSNGANINNGGTASVISNNFLSDPSFVNAGAGDFHIQSGSGARSYGANLTSLMITALDVDLDGVLRPTMSAWDAGAYQFLGGCTPYQLFFTGQPSSAYVRATLGTVMVEVRDVSGNLCNGASNSVTLAAAGSATWSALTSSTSLTKNASSGVATYTDLYVTPTAGSGAISASSSGLSSATSNSITISAATFTSSPLTATQGSTLVLTMTGTATAWANGSTVLTISGTGATINSTTCASATSCISSITLDAGATLGTRNLTMTTGSLVDTLNSGLTVVSAPNTSGGGIRIRALAR